ncbi:MFS transporter [Alteromonas oceanisediminis]|uniref:MFS transporter n=1 Tax=Alteromonas oceanisediminis TaxID=2836180 RepID=UPI001BD94F38|nr:MFS transporter [Alteromonas oceanisediminis]MBT0587369.1 MFS transporter [Alteromonas oceanisediminis]
MSTLGAKKPSLSFWQIWNMSFGFLGIQYGFGLQQANLSPIFRYHGAEEAGLPILWLAGPVTGLLIQPLIGAMSDGTWTRFGRRKPYFLFGALIASIAVMFMPYVPYLWMAVGLFWILDAGMNTAMEPYRALVGDKLNNEQRTLGYAVQTFMLAGGQMLAGLMPLIMLAVGVSAATDGNTIPDIVKYSFVIGVVAIIVSMSWTLYTTKEDPPDNIEAFKKEREGKNLFFSALVDIGGAVKNMPDEIRRLWWVKFFSWYGMPLMWQYLALSIARHSFNAPTPDSPGFAEGTANVGLAFTVMNVTTVVMSFLVPSITRKIGKKNTYALFLLVGGIGFISMLANDSLAWVLAAMCLVGIGWAGIITMPFIIAADVVDRKQMGVYMGLLNAFICLPQIISMVTIGFYYDSILMGDPRNALVLCGICLVIAAGFAMRLRDRLHQVDTADVLESETNARTMTER